MFKGIRRLLEHKINVKLKTILMTLNRHEFFDIENMAKDLGVKFRFDAAIFPCLNGDKTPLSLRVSPEDAVEKEFSDDERLRHWRDYFERYQGLPVQIHFIIAVQDLQASISILTATSSHV